MKLSVSATDKITKMLMASAIIAMPLVLSASGLSRAEVLKENQQPSIPHQKQNASVQDKLDKIFKETGKRPNILWLVVDDLGFGDIGGPWGGGAHIGAATPNIDAMANEGLALTSTYSQPTCTPTRSAMMLGRLPVRTGLIRPILAGDTIKKNPWEGEMSIAKLLSDAGYHTVLTGKWHTGELEGMRPHHVGFDEFQGYYASQKELTQQFDYRRYPDLVLDEEKFARFKKVSGKIDMYYGAKGQKEKVVVPTTGLDQFAEADHILADFTIEKIKTLAKGDKPFFISHNFMRVHADNHPSKAFKGKSASKYPFKDNVVEVDAHVGSMLAALKEAGVEKNTFVFFTSDNGPQRDAWPDGGYTPFKGGKGTAWEGGTRVPGIAYWKGMIEPGESAELFDLMDLYSTTARLAGVEDKIPEDRYIDGIDQTSFLLATEGKSHREQIYTWVGTEFTSLRVREYKMHLQVMQPQNAFQNIDYTTVSKVGLAPWLYNLYIDPKEELPVGHRLNPWLASIAAEAKEHGATFKKYPPKKIGL